MTYLALNATFLLTLFVVLNVLVRRTPWRVIGITTIFLLVLTVIFDNAIVGTGIVAYDASKISGLMIGVAPIEDFAYTLAAAILIPSVWILLERGGKK
ncbi:lycopene cyclase domain-containing protein [Rhodoluna sp.]|uniref:lycopene cyclase domain-containing protein n=1 Tax=Rhodoluna sp. TaxID=1969481 RepID=UPI0025F97823|nr:lycopene cyclase domain-containing protein [Rhodoluna sp.]